MKENEGEEGDQAPEEAKEQKEEEEKKVEVTSKNRIFLANPLPSIFSLNLNWEQRPAHIELLKMFLSIPSTFSINEIYETSEECAD